MASISNRRIRARNKRHAKTASRLRDREFSFIVNGRLDKADEVKEQLKAHLAGHSDNFRPAGNLRPEFRPPRREGSRRVGSLLNGPTSLVLEKQDPKVHGVNAQRENRSRPQVGGARGAKK